MGRSLICGRLFTADDLKAQFANDASAVTVLGGDKVATCGVVQLSDINNTGLVLDSLVIVLFGDVTGDGWYDGTDAYVVSLVANGMISENALTAAQQMAADYNHDGTIDSADAALLKQAGLLLTAVDQTLPDDALQTNGVYLEYCALIDQLIEIEEPATEQTQEPAAEQESIVARILNVFRSVFLYIFCHLFVKTA